MATAEQTYLRTELEQRRERLHQALHSPAADASLSELLKAVDTALSRLDQGTFGICETCHSSIEAERLLPDSSLVTAGRGPFVLADLNADGLPDLAYSAPDVPDGLIRIKGSSWN